MAVTVHVLMRFTFPNMYSIVLLQIVPFFVCVFVLKQNFCLVFVQIVNVAMLS